jgi:C-terminal processing protease CtpA/Prc
MRTLAADLRNADALVVDLRGAPGVMPPRRLLERTVLPVLAMHLPSREIVAPARVRVVHDGYRPQRGNTSGGYATAVHTDLRERWPAARGHRPTRIVFVANRDAPIPDLVMALQRAGDAQIVADGAISDAGSVELREIARGDGRTLVVRVTDLDPPLRADATIPALPSMKDDHAVDAALALAKKSAPKAAPAGAPAPPVVWRPDDVYAGTPYPSRERRLLALFRFWNIIHFFYPYLDLMGGAWDGALVDFIPKLEAAGDAEAYALAIAELAARIPDAHVAVLGGAALERLFGVVGPPITVQRIHGLPVVTVVEEEAKTAGLAVGDVIESVDGESLDARVARLRAYVPASNAWSQAYHLDRVALRGPLGSSAALVVRDADGRARSVSVARIAGGQATGRAYSVLPEGFGYVDLARLDVADVAAMFDALGAAPGIVFDMRGYPRGTAWTIAPRLAAREQVPAALFSRPTVGDVFGPGRHAFVDRLPLATGPRYHGATVMLVDERTVSQAEHTGLYFEVANGTTFVGSPTAGANGDVTTTCLPANVCVWFTGNEVRHADGRQLQRVGLVPEVTVRPTLGGLRKGRDEVLERALEVLRSKVK